MIEIKQDWAPVPLRVIVGIGFIFHGSIKLFTTSGHEIFQRLLQEIGIPLSTFFSWFIGALEFFGGIAILIGAFISLTSILLIINMLVAMFTVNLPNGFDVMNVTVLVEAGPKFGIPGFEINLLYIASMLTLIILGSGKCSIDDLLKKKPEDKDTA